MALPRGSRCRRSAQPVEARTGNDVAASTIRMATILYVDDELSVQRVVRLWLERRRHHVLTASSLAEAKRAIAGRQTIDGVFIDLWLGTESGFDLQEWIEAHVPPLARHLAFVTGDTTPEEPYARRLAESGVPVLGKPFDFGAFEAVVRGWTG